MIVNFIQTEISKQKESEELERIKKSFLSETIIVKEYYHIEMLKEWLPPDTKTTKLLYRGSVHGFTAQAFH